MNDRYLIYGGLILFVVLVTFPIWQGIAMNTSTAGPGISKAVGKQSCVAPLETMRKSHMGLLMDWRNDKVREQKRQYRAYDGQVYTVSLTGTCLSQCHGGKDQFCDRCHAYAGVPAPDCWGCHATPPEETAPLTANSAGGLR